MPNKAAPTGWVVEAGGIRFMGGWRCQGLNSTSVVAKRSPSPFHVRDRSYLGRKCGRGTEGCGLVTGSVGQAGAWT